MRRLKMFSVAVALSLLAPLAQAAEYPQKNKPIKIVVPYTAGGSSDFVARTVAKKLGENLNHTVIVENKPGAGTIIAADYVAQSVPDGYTLLLMGELTHSALPALHKELPFDPIESFTPITNLVGSPLVAVVPASLPVETFQEFIEYAKERPGQLTYGSAGLGNTLHLAGEDFQTATGTELVHIPYKGASQALVDLLAGRIDVMFDLPQTPMSQIKEGKLKGLAITSPERLAELPDVPTTAEAGVPEFNFSTYIGLGAPAGVPDEVIEFLFNELRTVMADPEVQENMATMSMFVKTSASPEEFQQAFVERIAEIGETLANAGVQPE